MSQSIFRNGLKIVVGVSGFLAICLMVAISLNVFQNSSNNSNANRTGVSISATKSAPNAPYTADLAKMLARSKGALVEVNAIIRYKGVISNIYKKPLVYNNQSIEKGLKIKGFQGESALFFLKNELSLVTIYKKSNSGENQVLVFDDLNIGDRVEVEVVKDLSQPFSDGINTRGVKIVKL